ncbi:MAG: prepilin-type N-terminal cleavage/methylation domain-containing protein [bacterium]
MINLFKNQKGFTLAEIVVVIGIFVLIVILVLSIYMLSQKAYFLGDNKAEIDQNGRIAFDRLSREIRQTKEIVTQLPETDDDQDFPPANEIMFEDGHDSTELNYIRYHLIGTNLMRQVLYYYFSGDPDTHVVWDAKDEGGYSPIEMEVEDRLIGEYFDILEFYQPGAVNIYAKLTKNTYHLYLNTKIFGRNLR